MKLALGLNTPVLEPFVTNRHIAFDLQHMPLTSVNIFLLVLPDILPLHDLFTILQTSLFVFCHVAFMGPELLLADFIPIFKCGICRDFLKFGSFFTGILFLRREGQPTDLHSHIHIRNLEV